MFQFRFGFCLLFLLLPMESARAQVSAEVFACGGRITDAAGNAYWTVRIGDQCWMAQNLRTSVYRDGTAIPGVSEPSVWTRLRTGAWAHYDNEAAHDSTHGKLYNGFAVSHRAGLCPVGWHVPTDAEWDTLVRFLEKDAGHLLKSASGWNGSNLTDFNALPSGNRRVEGGFFNVGRSTVFWSSTANGPDQAWSRSLLTSYRDLFRFSNDRRYGYSVRCVMD